MCEENILDMPTEKYPGVVEFFLESSLSPSQLWMEKTTEALSIPKVVSDPVAHHVSLRRHRAMPPQSWEIIGTTYHPTSLLRVNIAAIGSVVDIVEEISVDSPELLGSW